MQRLSAVDADASAAVKVIDYFDTLLARGAGIAAFVRGAAVLAGCPAGLAHPRHRIWIRADPTGDTSSREVGLDDVSLWPHEKLDDASDGVVWIERVGDPQSSDAVLLERLSAGIHITLERISPMDVGDDAAAVEILLSPTSTGEMQRKAARRLRIPEDAELFVTASPINTQEHPSRRTATMHTSVGMIRATLSDAEDPFPKRRTGIGPTVAIPRLPESWAKALTALRLTSNSMPILRWEAIGPLVLLTGEMGSPAPSHPDLDRIEAIAQEPWGLATLDALTTNDSLRSAAACLDIHHSTMQHRKELIEDALGFDVGMPWGRTRLVLSLGLYRLHHNTFGPTPS
ncbi:MAG: helix-turn-helix domain-containing protein [Acidimicrobiia bacterium]